LLPYLSCLKTGKGFIYKLITYISLISYSIYLIHLSIVQKWILRKIDWTLLENFNGYLFLLMRYSLYWILTIIISILLYKYFEIPTMNLRDKVKVK
jgi:peptidoglycan/LPS O-acetylase OafA/YrhL